ncbi:ThrRS/AlaRS common domain-containing protein [Wolfiporia cocos MD-104 SS10]|uniref:ThrRS/AlaRS common domain-containing protein n=1 Tax=Wolfiporia cocos (strain MD-104) TaxID=742152 RepID=A0A2H3JXP5_WOLCO|nr:ThrRS/AlaRS common domain-containing protein [Wolfiporia cocos MD-104 SS10]
MSATVVLLPPVTPPTYHRIVSPTLKVPDDPQFSIPVGLLACQRDPLLYKITTTVVSCTVSQSPPSNGKKSKKDKAPPSPTEPLLEVVLHDTVIFPEGGGQPSDIGLLTTADGEVWNVVEAKRHGGHAVHYVRAKSDNTDAALAAFTPGTTVVAALGEEGFKRRLDHMSMHTSQHLLSAVIEKRLNLPTLSWATTAFPAPCYIEIPRSMTPEEIASVQEEANRLVFEGRSIHVEVQELDQAGIEGGQRSASKGLPVDYTGGIKRAVIIDRVDRSLCCGTHMPSLHNHQLFILPHTDTLARGSTSSARLYFVAGPRLLHYAGSAHALLTRAAATLSCGAPLVPERVEQLVDDRKRATKRVEDVEGELAALLARELIRIVSEKVDGPVLLHRHRTDDSVNALGFLNAISMAFANEVAGKSDPPSYLVVLSSSPSAQIASSTSVVLIFGSDEKKVREVGEGLKTKLGVRGGGKGTRWSGKFTGVWLDAREGAMVKEVLQSARV